MKESSDTQIESDVLKDDIPSEDKKCCCNCTFLVQVFGLQNIKIIPINNRSFFLDSIYIDLYEKRLATATENGRKGLKDAIAKNVIKRIEQVYKPQTLACYHSVWSDLTIYDENFIKEAGLDPINVDLLGNSHILAQAFRKIQQECTLDNTFDHKKQIKEISFLYRKYIRIPALVDERNDCFFYKYAEGMGFKAAEKLERREADRFDAKKDRELTRDSFKLSALGRKVSTFAFLNAILTFAMNFLDGKNALIFPTYWLLSFSFLVSLWIFLRFDADKYSKTDIWPNKCFKCAGFFSIVGLLPPIIYFIPAIRFIIDTHL
jgi:hypothetical protein